MITHKRIALANIAIFLLCCTVINSYADGSHHRKYDHNKGYFDYYNDKPSHRHDNRRHYKNKSHRNTHRHTRMCKKQHRHPFAQVHHHRGRHQKHWHHDGHNSGLRFVFKFLH